MEKEDDDGFVPYERKYKEKYLKITSSDWLSSQFPLSYILCVRRKEFSYY